LSLKAEPTPARHSLDQLHDLDLHLALVDQHDAERHRQFESTRPSASRIDEKRRAAAFDCWLVRMPGDDHVNAVESLRNVRYVMNEMNRGCADMERQRFRQVIDPRTRVVITAARGDGRELVDRIEDSGIADIAGVNDVLAAAQSRERLGAHEVVGIGDDANADHR
jgi:hypothetical protein